MQFNILTLFPDIIYSYCNQSILGRAEQNNLISVQAHNFREFSGNKWGHVDDKPFGGGPGMVLRVEPIYECLKAMKVIRNKEQGTRNKRTKIIIMDPAGKKFDQRMAERFSKLDNLVLICGRYEGFDARVYKLADERVSVGDYVLAGGELPALTIVEAVSRLLPGVLGNAESLAEETFGGTRKEERGKRFHVPHSTFHIPRSTFHVPRSSREYPQYTRPTNFMGQTVPKVLLSGNHKLIAEWRKKNSK